MRFIRSIVCVSVLGALTAPAFARGTPAPSITPATVLISATVGESATSSMPQPLWRKIVSEYVGARNPVFDNETTLADDTRCRAAHAVYAVLATFDRATRLPGLAQDTDRIYGIARFTIRNCLTGDVVPTKAVHLESDPISEASRGDFEPNPEHTWDRSVRSALARDPLIKPVTRVAIVSNGVVLLERGPSFVVNQIVRGVADASGQLRRPYELIVLNIAGKYIEATVVGNGDPHVGDYVEAMPAK